MSLTLMGLFVFITSFTLLSYEIILVRIFSITGYQNFSSIIISMALLGFGVSGTILFLLRNKILKNFNNYFLYALFLYPIFLCIGFILYTKIPFNPFKFGIDNNQMLYLILSFLVIALPFFFGASVIGLSFLKYKINKIYFVNLIGSGFGAICVILLSYIFHPYNILVILIAISYCSSLIGIINLKQKMKYLIIIIHLLLFLGFYNSFDYLNLKDISPYKSISRALMLPDAQILDEKYSPLGLIQSVTAKGLRQTVGLSLLSPFDIPEQRAIFYDGEGMSMVTLWDNDKSKIEYLKYVPQALSHYLLSDHEKKDILIVGVGGGEGILKALAFDFKNIDGLEINRDVILLMKKRFLKYSGRIYEKANIINREARGYIKTTNKYYNLIEIEMIDTYNTASSGVYALNETYLYTEDAIIDMLKILKDNGIISITRWILTPPRDNIKMVNTIIHALRKTGIEDVSKHILCIRSIQTFTTIVSKNPIDSDKILKAKEFSNTRLFDLVYYDGIKASETNRFIKMGVPGFYEAIKKLLSSDYYKFQKNYLFNINPSKDIKPYFYNFIKFKTIKYISEKGITKITIAEWGYLLLIFLLVPVTLISFVLIIGPLLFMKEKINESIKMFDVKILAYFSFIAIGFFFVEMPLIQRLILFLSHPSYSLSVIISSLLIAAGIGSYVSNRIFKKENRILYAIIFIILILLIYILCLDYIFLIFINKHIMFKIIVTLIIILPLGFFMGFPFPQGLIKIASIDKTKIALVWGINGFFSVISIILASLLSILLGFNSVFLFACFFYLIAAIIYSKLPNKS